MSLDRSFILKVIAVLWVIWGLVHFFAGVMTIAQPTTAAVQSIADGTPSELLAVEYPDAAGGVVNQHGWNLGWFGIVTILGGVLIWRANRTAIWVTAMVGGLADLGYFIFLDLPGYVNFFPGTVMTLVSGSAILLSLIVWFGRDPA